MKVLIQQVKSGYYLHAKGTWISEREGALAFEYGADAVKHCIHNQLRGVHLHYCDSNPEMDFVLNPFGTKRTPEAQRLGPDTGPAPRAKPISDL